MAGSEAVIGRETVLETGCDRANGSAPNRTLFRKAFKFASQIDAARLQR